MKQRWMLQARPFGSVTGNWINLKPYRKIKDARLSDVQKNAKQLGLRADYRLVLKYIPTNRERTINAG